MTKTPAPNHGPSLDVDGDATDAEINRKLTEHLRANAIKVTPDVDMVTTAQQPAGFGRRSALIPARAFAMAIAQIFGLVVLIILMIFASIHAHLYEKEAR